MGAAHSKIQGNVEAGDFTAGPTLNSNYLCNNLKATLTQDLLHL